MNSTGFKNLKRWRLGGMEPERSQIEIAAHVTEAGWPTSNSRISLIEGGLQVDDAAEKKALAAAYGLITVDEFERLNAGLSLAEWEKRQAVSAEK